VPFEITLRNSNRSTSGSFRNFISFRKFGILIKRYREIGNDNKQDMKNKVLQIHYFSILLSLTIAFSSCSQLPEYKVKEDGEGIYMVELSERPNIETLKSISDEIKNERGKKDCLIVFCIPSEYPYYPAEPWATVSYTFEPSNNENSSQEQMIMKIMGARTEKDKEALINIIPKNAKSLKVWYHNHPMQEGLVVMEDNEFKFYQLPKYIVSEGLDYEISNETLQTDQYLHPDITEAVISNETSTQFRNSAGKMVFYIDDKGRLIEVRADGSKLIMDPITIKS